MSAGGFRKMYLIDPRCVVPATSVVGAGSMSSEKKNGASLLSAAAAATDSSLHDAAGENRSAEATLKERLSKLDEEMERIIRNRVLTDEEKLHRYLETLRRYIVSSRQLSRIVDSPLAVKVISSSSSSVPDSSMKKRSSKMMTSTPLKNNAKT
jgi:hypothetical protein